MPNVSSTEPPTVNISARIPRDLGRQLDAAAKATRRHKSQLIVEALTLYGAVLAAGQMIAPDPMLADRRTPDGSTSG